MKILAAHVEDGWYIGPSLEHYRCVKFYLPSTNAILDALILVPNKYVWLHALSNKLGWLDQGRDRGLQSTDTTDSIFIYKVPDDCNVTYVSFLCEYKPL